MNADKLQKSKFERPARAAELSAIFEKVPASQGGGFVVYSINLPGAISEGATLKEARENLRDAIATLMEVSDL